MSKEVCPECSSKYKELGSHWQWKPNHRPSLSEKQREIIIGSLLGDGDYDVDGEYFRWQDMITHPYLDWISDQFGVLVSDVMDRGCRNCGWKSTFTLKTRPMEELGFCLDWGYSKNGFSPKLPNGIGLTPTILKTWYCSDGCVCWGNGGFVRVEIGCKTHIHEEGILSKMFDDIGLDVTFSSPHIIIPKSQTEVFFDYIGAPPSGSEAGFAYKWEYDDYEEYNRLKEIHDKQPYLEDEDA